MNLKLDSNSIRLRVTHAEAMRLASEYKLSERLLIFEGEFELRLSIGESLNFVSDVYRKFLDFYISTKNLETILSVLKNNPRPKKEDCFVKGDFNLGGRPVEVRIEVDRLSLIK